MGGAAVFVDVDAVWLRVDAVHLSPLGLEGGGRCLKSSPVRAVDDDLDVLQTDWFPKAIDQMRHVRLDKRLLDNHPADAGAGGPGPRLNQPGLDRILERVVELAAAARKELDAVVGHRVVAGRKHDTKVRVAFFGEKGDPGRWQYAEPYHIHPGAGQTGDNGGLQELT